MVCPKCKLPLNSDHVHRTYEEHDACRNADWRTLSVTAIAAENSSVAEYVKQLEQQHFHFKTHKNH